VFTSTAPHITLDNQRTVPCGLLVHELVLNAFKHAFKDAVLSASDTGSGARQPGRIDVALGQTTAGCMQLTVSDNGCGLPAGFAWGGKGGAGDPAGAVICGPVARQNHHGVVVTRCPLRDRSGLGPT
ncbi:MAG: hypothetical protein WAV85_14085, partial [Rhodoferax sp.]